MPSRDAWYYSRTHANSLYQHPCPQFPLRPYFAPYPPLPNATVSYLLDLKSVAKHACHSSDRVVGRLFHPLLRKPRPMAQKASR
jgi:hypothetical protein